MTKPMLDSMRTSNPFMRIISSIIIVAFMMLLLEPTAIAAQTILNNQTSQSDITKPLIEAELSDTIQKIQKKIQILQEKIANKQDVDLEKSDLKKLHKIIKKLDKIIIKKFAKLEDELKEKKLSDVIMQRHYDMVAN